MILKKIVGYALQISSIFLLIHAVPDWDILSVQTLWLGGAVVLYSCGSDMQYGAKRNEWPWDV